MPPFGIYLHIPYCQSRCRYCDFYTAPAHREVPDTYIDALLRAYEAHRALAPAGRPASVYFGGGTPGLLRPAQVGRLLAAIQPAPGAEITLEVNPGEETVKRLPGWKSAGVNRLSVGLQTANEASLRRLGRLHGPQQAAETLAAAQKAGFTNLSADIMLALPGYTRAEFDSTLALARAGGVCHLSAYLLKIEPNTAFGRAAPAGLPTPDEAADFYLYAVHQLEKAGFAQYEISNFARPGFAGRHNLLYWNCRDYLGLGPAAHSSLSGVLYSFPPNTGAFISGEAPLQTEGPLTADDYIMLRLRLAEGLDEEALFARYNRRLTPAQNTKLSALAAGGLVRREAGRVALTPRGMLVQNAVLAALL